MKGIPVYKEEEEEEGWYSSVAEHLTTYRSSPDQKIVMGFRRLNYNHVLQRAFKNKLHVFFKTKQNIPFN